MTATPLKINPLFPSSWHKSLVESSLAHISQLQINIGCSFVGMVRLLGLQRASQEQMWRATSYSLRATALAIPQTLLFVVQSRWRSPAPSPPAKTLLSYYLRKTKVRRNYFRDGKTTIKITICVFWGGALGADRIVVQKRCFFFLCGKRHDNNSFKVLLSRNIVVIVQAHIIFGAITTILHSQLRRRTPWELFSWELHHFLVT